MGASQYVGKCVFLGINEIEAGCCQVISEAALPKCAGDPQVYLSETRAEGAIGQPCLRSLADLESYLWVALWSVVFSGAHEGCPSARECLMRNEVALTLKANAVGGPGELEISCNASTRCSTVQRSPPGVIKFGIVITPPRMF